MPQPLIEAKNLTLHVPVFQPDDRRLLSNPGRFLSDLYFSRNKRRVVRILEDISFTLSPGMRLGVIGANGAGKSTLLRVLMGIYAPTTGHLTVNGIAKGLFDISLGMNSEATGLENIYIRGLQMGLKLREIRNLLEKIIDFAELEEDIEKPFGTFSSGMRLRLAVAISTIIEPDILLLDEWIGASDAHFRRKIRARMETLVEQSRGLVLATHNAGLMEELCTDGLVLSKGRLLFCGELEQALRVYENENTD